MPPPSSVAYDVSLPRPLRLRFATTVAGDDGHEGGVRFRVRVAGAVRYERVVRPMDDAAHGRWQRAEIALQAADGETTQVVFETELVGETLGVRVRPAWSRVQLLEERRVPRQHSSVDTPNVIVLVVDTLRADRLGVYGAVPSATPHLDRVAAAGTVFENAWAQAPWTLPSIASLLTGRYPAAHGLVGRAGSVPAPGAADDERDRGYLPDTMPTVATLARAGGITTVAMTSNLLLARDNNLANGFETFTALPMRGRPPQWARAGALHAAFGRWLDGHADLRFLAYLHYMEPHDPYVAPSEHGRTCPPGASAGVCEGLIRIGARRREEGGPLPPRRDVAHLAHLYDAEVRAWDAALPELLAMLETRGLGERTVLIVTADHGEEFGEHGHLGHRKQLYRESLAVPLVLHGPGIPAARRSDLAELVDVLPTVSGLLGVPVPAGLPGRDLLRTTQGRAWTFAETRHGTGDPGERDRHLQSVRSAEWLLLRDAGSARLELHDRRGDAAERLATTRGRGDVVRRLAAVLDRWQADHGPQQKGGGNEVDLGEQLRQLGYRD